MNIGQIFECHLGFVAYLLGIKIESNAFNGATKDDVVELLDFVWQLANEDDGDMVLSHFSRSLPPELIHIADKRRPFIREWCGCFNKDGSAVLMNPVTGKPFELPITFGVAYILKLSHQVAHKMHVRDTNGKYSRIEKQPVRGQAGNGGQRVGEMELAALSAHGATAIIREMLNEKSDNVTLREKLANLPAGEQISMEDMAGTSTRSVELLRYYMEGIGLNVDVSGGSDLSLGAVSKRQRPGRRPAVSKERAEDYDAAIDQGLAEFQSFTDEDTVQAVFLKITADPLANNRAVISSDPLVRD
jgi:DNA-directed RNA polymerase subunit beta